ncbi:MAG: hypothetical protein KDK06_01140 [Gammaproteobacteria bacterium]|nr:hypothetical protein [Gammaproteobacteria bacterium]
MRFARRAGGVLRDSHDCGQSLQCAALHDLTPPVTMELNAVYNTVKDMLKRIDALRGYL